VDLRYTVTLWVLAKHSNIVTSRSKTRTVLSNGEPHDTSVNFHTYGILQRQFFGSSWPHPYSTLILRVFSLDYIAMLGSMWAGTLSYKDVKLVPKYSNVLEKHTMNVTDGQTGGQTDVVSRGKNVEHRARCCDIKIIMVIWRLYYKNIVTVKLVEITQNLLLRETSACQNWNVSCQRSYWCERMTWKYLK